MRSARLHPLVRLLPSLTDAAFLLPVVFLFWTLNGASRMLEGDTGWHIRTGEWIMANARVPRLDLFSFSRPGEPWFAWEWLWDVVFAWLHQRWGLPIVVWVSLVLICLTFALVFRLTRSKCQNVLVAFGMTWLAVAGSSIHWWARPHVFTMLFTAWFLWVLERARAGRTGLLWMLPAVMVPWVNLHGGFAFGLVLIGTYCAGEWVAAAIEPGAAERKRFLLGGVPYALTLAASAAATLVNPYGYHLHLHIYQNLTSPDSPFPFINEWQPTALRGPLALYVEPVLILTVAAAVWHLINRRFTYSLLLIGFFYVGLSAGRNVPLLVIVCVPFCAELIQEALVLLRRAGVAGWVHYVTDIFEEIAGEFGAIDRLPRLYVASAIPLLLLLPVLLAPRPLERFCASYDAKIYPVTAIDALGSKLGGKLFTDDEWGDYVIYRLYPATRVFVDGRFDFYGGKFTQNYLDLMGVKFDWERQLKAYGIDTVLLSVKAPLSGTLKESRRWRAVYDDGTAIVFRLANPVVAGGRIESTVHCDRGNIRGLIAAGPAGGDDIGT